MNALKVETIGWGIIGCGDVTEVKSGPAFNKVANSSLVAVMRRDAAKAEDYAKRHAVPNWYDNAEKLIRDPKVGAIYIATPPDSHEQYTLAALAARKPVYVEKPMALNFKSAQKMYNAAAACGVKLVVAHYRREWPLFKKLKQLIDDNAIGDVHVVRLAFDKNALSVDELSEEKIAWRVNPAIAGGGLFHDLAPHQLDILYYLFGAAKKVCGVAVNQAVGYGVHDMVAGSILFQNGVAFNGSWCFNAPIAKDVCEIIGSEGKITFGFFGNNSIELTVGENITRFNFDLLEHVQQPMIEKVVQYFLGQGDNPCGGNEGALILKWIEKFVN